MKDLALMNDYGFLRFHPGMEDLSLMNDYGF